MKTKKPWAALCIVFFVLLAKANISYTESSGKASFDSKHNDRSSLFLLYSVDTKVNSDWSYVTKVHKRIKILKDGAKGLGEIPIYYDNNREKITDLEAFTIAPDNQKHQYSKIQDLNIYEGCPMYSDSMVKVITLPEVTVGSILEHKFTIVSKGMAIKNAYWSQFFIDSPVPMKELRYSITMPKSLDIKNKEFGLTRKPKITQDKDNITYAWVVKNIEAEEDTEDYLPPPTPERLKEGIEFSSIKNWQDISSWYASLVKKNMKVNKEIEEIVNRVTKNKSSVRDKTRAILEYIQKDFRYVSMSFGDNALEPHPTDEVFRNKYGDCKDLSLLCKVMLGVAGINSQVCLFNTEGSITDPQYDLPIPSLFDHVLLLVNDPKEGDFYADPLLDGYDIGQYPLSYQMAHTFIVNGFGGKLARFPVFDEKRDYTSCKKSITIKKDGSALIEADSLWDLDFSVEQRDKLNSLNTKQKAKFFEGLDAYLAAGGQMIKRDIVGLDQKYGIMKACNKMTLKDAYPITDGLMIIDIAGFDRGQDFTDKDRKNPIFYPFNSINEEVTTYRIPKGYVISYVPNDLNLNNGFISIRREYKKTGNEIQVTEITRHKRVEIPQKDYANIRDFYENLSAKNHQSIIVKTAP